MTAHRITYEGPAELAMGTATRLADADGVGLTSANRPEPLDHQPGRVRLALTVDGSPEAVATAIRLVGGDLPTDARVTLEDAG